MGNIPANRTALLRAAVIGEFSSAIKSLRRRPLPTALLIVSLGVGMAIATRVFAMLEPLVNHTPFATSKQVAQVYEYDTRHLQESPGVPARHLLALLETPGKWTSVSGAKAVRPLVFGSNGSAASVSSIVVTPNYFETVGAHMAIGRAFSDADGTTGAPAVAVVSHAVWLDRLGGPRDLSNVFVTIDGRRVRVLGVLPVDFTYPFDADIWLPTGRDELRRIAANVASDWPRFLLLGRTGDATLPAATAWTQTVIDRADADAGVKESPRVHVLSVADAERRSTISQSTVWIAIASVVLLLCATNFATGFLGMAMNRRQELAIRSSLGASTRRLAQLFGAEATLLGLGGGAVAIVLSVWLSGLTSGDVGAGAQPIGALAMGWQVILFGLAGTVLIGVTFGLAPILQLCRGDLRVYLAGGAAVGKSRLTRDRGALVGLQVSLAVLCIASVAVLVYADRRWESFGPGYDYERVLTARVFASDPARLQTAEQPLLDFVRAIPAVESAALVHSPAGEGGAIGLSSADHPNREAGLPWIDASSGLFSTLGIAASPGRLPTPDEIASRAPVAVLTTSAALNIGIGPHPIGTRVRLDLSHGHKIWLTVIGVVPDVRRGPDFSSFDTPVFSSLALPADTNGTELMIRVRGDATASIRELKTAFAKIDLPVVVSDLKPVSSDVEAFDGRARQRRGFLAAISLVSLILASIGAYGLSNYIAAARAKEIHIRIALGASTVNVTRVVLGDLFAMALGGSVLGLLVASRFAEILNVVLRGPRSTSVPLTYVPLAPAITGAAMLLGISLLGSLVPIRKITKQSLADGLR